ncbi:hypothetical protein CEXT_790541 [Caerostris extrusa]|uniref:Uncharacterized protein n=1 Tax=Caerostris extrusa TaxID=172846 RepID=A0AAV4T1I2_CAEEX|nr:hypothetical protein CEXT_790541 [Caerostris extrusa]
MSWNDKRYWKSMNSKKMAKGPSTQKSQIVLSHFAISEFKTEEEVEMSQGLLLSSEKDSGGSSFRVKRKRIYFRQ